MTTFEPPISPGFLLGTTMSPADATTVGELITELSTKIAQRRHDLHARAERLRQWRDASPSEDIWCSRNEALNRYIREGEASLEPMQKVLASLIERVCMRQVPPILVILPKDKL